MPSALHESAGPAASMAPTWLLQRRATLLALALTFLVPLAVVAALFWPLPLDPAHTVAPSIFGPHHVWCGERIWRIVSGQEPLLHTREAGFPWVLEARYIGWVPLLAITPLRPFIGPLTAFNLALLLSLPVSALATWPLVRRWTGTGPWTAAAACIAFALCPFALGNLQDGEVPKLQVGLLPLCLYALQRSLDAPSGRRWALATAALACSISFTCAYVGLFLPPLCLAMLALDAWRRHRLRRPLALGLLVAVALLPAWFYYRPVLPLDGVRLLWLPASDFRPGLPMPATHWVATLPDLLLGLPQPASQTLAPHLIGYLGTPLIAILSVWAWRRREPHPGRRIAISLLIAGAVLSLGPVLYLSDEPTSVPLPAMLLHLVRYPIAQGGMYHRLAAIGALGLALWLAAELATRPRLAWLLLALQVGDALRASGPWPSPAVPVPGAEMLARMGGDDGAVLDLPLEFEPSRDGLRLLRAALSGRPTATLPHVHLPWERRDLANLWEPAFQDEDPRAALRALGVRFVVLDRLDPYWRARADRLTPPWMEADGLVSWDLGPAARTLPPPPGQTSPEGHGR